MPVLNDKIEFKCSAELRADWEILVAELTPKLRKRLDRRVLVGDVFQLLMNTYKKAPWLLEEAISGKPSIK
jgi:hypothetical protein